MGGERLTAFRINTLKCEPDAVIKSLEEGGFTLSPINWIRHAFTVPVNQRRLLTESGFYERGEIYIQNPASMVPHLVLDPKPDERVLDLAAAPGSKSLQMAAMMDNEGWISAVEVVRERFFRLRRNLEKHGAQNVHTYNKDGSRVWRQVPEQFDKVLLDAPCSSEGRFSLLLPDSYKYWSDKKIKEMARKQKRLLYSAVQCLKPGGELVYSTCTFAPEENEAIVSAMLKKFSDNLIILPIELELPNMLPGNTEWRGRKYYPDMAQARRLLPTNAMEGFYVCRMKKLASTIDD